MQLSPSLPVERSLWKNHNTMASNIPSAFKRKQTNTMPAIYIPHGGGPLPVMGDSRHKALIKWLSSVASTIPKPKCILVISAHWEEKTATVLTGAKPPLFFDYYNFPKETYKYKYPAPGHPVIASRVKELLENVGISCAANGERGFDHGVFVPLLLMYPKGDIPVIQLSLVEGLDPELHIRMGRAIASLRDEGVLILGSGSSYHNMRDFGETAREPSELFDAYLVDACTNSEHDEQKREQLLCDWRKAPAALACHPREEHLIPLMVVAGAAGTDRGKHVFNNSVFSVKMFGVQFG